MSTEPEEKPWRPGDHPRPGPSWAEGEPIQEHEAIPAKAEE